MEEQPGCVDDRRLRSVPSGGTLCCRTGAHCILIRPTPRDFDLFRAIDRGPLTVRQLLKLSATFSSPFHSERYLQARLYLLTQAGLLRRGAYATTDPSVLYYYTLSPESSRHRRRPRRRTA